MIIYRARLIGGYHLSREEAWALPILWSDDGKMQIGPPRWGKEAEALKDFPIDDIHWIADLAFKYIKDHPELMSEEFHTHEVAPAHG